MSASRSFQSRYAGLLLRVSLLTVIVLFVALPLLWMLFASFKGKMELYQAPPTFLPMLWTWQNYVDLFTTTRFPRYFMNSLIVAVGTTLLSITTSALAAYSLSRFRFFGFSLYTRAVLLTYMLPSILLVLPLYELIVQYQLADTRIGLILTHTAYTFPLLLWLLRSHFNTVPVEVEESALVDGCSRLRALLLVVLPVAAPGIASISIFSFTRSWNEFLFALVLMSSEINKTLPVGLSTWIADDNIFSWGMLLAGAVLICLPAFVLYLFVQRWLVVGLGTGSVKG